MMKILWKISYFVLGGIILTGCSITQKVEPVSDNTAIDKVWIEDNPSAKHDIFDEEMATTIQKLGFKSEVFPHKQQPEESTFILKYYVRWQWDLALYLKEFRGTLYKDAQEIGSIVYDATAGGANMGKFGTTMSKVNPLLEELLKNAKPGEVIKVEKTEISNEIENATVEIKLTKLQDLFSQGLITEKDYSNKKTLLLKQL